MQNTTIKIQTHTFNIQTFLFINYFPSLKFKVQQPKKISPHPLFLLSPDFCFWKKIKTNFPSLTKFLKNFPKSFPRIFYCNKIYFIRIFYFIQNLFYNIHIHLFFLWPPGGGACRFLYRDNNMMQYKQVIIFLAQKACLI